MKKILSTWSDTRLNLLLFRYNFLAGFFNWGLLFLRVSRDDSSWRSNLNWTVKINVVRNLSNTAILIGLPHAVCK